MSRRNTSSVSAAAPPPGPAPKEGGLARDVAEVGRAGALRRGRDLEAAPVRSVRHLGRIFSAEPLETELVLGQGVAHGGAQQIAAIRIVERLPVAPALAIEQLDLLGRLAPALARPHDVRAQPDRDPLVDIRDDLEPDVMSPGIRQGARL